METNDKYIDLLEKHNLRRTEARLRVLSILNSREVATSQPDLEQMLGDEVGRVTLYRVLSLFEKSGIIHKIIDLNGTSNYALCSPLCTSEKHKDEHVHFNCTVCLNIYCMDEIHIPAISIPEGFKAESKNLIIYGSCESCNKKDKE
ncbi:MAG: Fur family transcriptional regulator [Sphingobacteriaceae bacterium]